MEKENLIKPDYQSEIVDIINSNDTPKKMLEHLSDYHENDIAEVLLTLAPAKRKKLYRILESDQLSDILEYMEEDEMRQCLNEMDIKKAANILSKMETDAAVTALKGIERQKRMLLIELLEEDAKKDIALIASFDEDEIGSKMTTNCIIIEENLSVKQAMSSLVKQASQNDNISTLFIVDQKSIFCGALDLKELIIARDGDNLDDLVVTSYPYVYGNELIDDCIEKLKDYSEDSIPVLDEGNHFLGVITSQSIIEVVDDEMGEDYAKLAGLTAEEDLKEPLTESMKKRLPWLMVLLALGMVVSSVVGAFESVVAELPIIMSFQSLILDMAGNVGTQSLAVTIRVLMDENLTLKQKMQLLGKEIRIGGCNGILLGILSLLFAGLYIWLVKGKPMIFAFSISSCIGVSLLVAMIVSSAVGTLIPMFFEKIHVDPAVASGPLITTVNDLVAVVCYYGLSWIFLIQLMGFSG